MSTVYTDVDVDKSGPQYDNPVDNSVLYELAVSENPHYAKSTNFRKHRRSGSTAYPSAEDMPDQRMYDDRTIVEQDHFNSMKFEATSSTDDAEYIQTS